MKRILLTLTVILALVIPAQAQEKEKEEKLNQLEKLEQQAETATLPDTAVLEEEIAIMTEIEDPDPEMSEAEEIIDLEDTGDETVIRIGNKAVKIISEDPDTKIVFENCEETNKTKSPGRRFKGHLGGFEFGYNNYSTDKWGQNSYPVDGYLDLNTAKSTSFNFIMPAVNLGISRHFGLVTALGLNFNNYRFEGNNSIAVDGGGIVTPVYPPEGIQYDKSKLATVYGVLPVILEAQIPVSYSNTINLGAGVIGAVKLGSHTKVVYYDDGKQKDKNRSDFNLNVLRWGVTARAGYEMVQVYGTCYLSQMFEKGKGPELYPFEVGVALTFND